jgi:hypothetical protein
MKGVAYDLCGSGIRDGSEENSDDTSGSHFDCCGRLLVEWLLGKLIRYVSDVVLV